VLILCFFLEALQSLVFTDGKRLFDVGRSVTYRLFGRRVRSVDFALDVV